MSNSLSFKVALVASTALSSIGFTANVYAQDVALDAAADVEEVVITANRRAQPITNVGKSISVIGEAALEASQYTFVLDALQSVPGVAINQNGSFGGTAFVSIRGASTDQTVVLVDGVQVNDPSVTGGAFDFANLDPNGIERIEVLRGPQAVLYGSDAMGGVINIITKSGTEGLSGNAFAEYGSYNSFRAGGAVSGGTERIGYSLSASYRDTDGISAADGADGNSERDGYENLTLRGKVSAKFSEAARLELMANYSDSESEYDGFAFVNGAYALGDTDDLSKSEEVSLAARGFFDLWDGVIKNTVSLEYSEIERTSFTGGVESYGAKGERVNFDYLGALALSDDLLFTTGLQHETVKAETQSNEAISTDSIFALLSYEGVKGLTLTGGVRYDDHETFGGTTNAEVSMSYLFEETGTQIIANWGEGFKAPTIFQLTYSCCGFDPNPNLQPERANAWEMGVRQTVLDDKLTLGATYFDQRTEDLIIFTFTGGYQNVSRARAKGVELTVDANLTDSLSVNGNYTHTSAKDRDTDTVLVRRPKDQAYAAINWAPTDKLSGLISLTYNGRELDSSGAYAPSWTRVDLRAAYKLNESVELYGRVDNLFDESYQQVLGYGTPGLSVFGGVRTRF